MEIQEAIEWFETKLMVNGMMGFQGGQTETAKMAIEALREKQKREAKPTMLTLKQFEARRYSPVWIKDMDDLFSGWCVVLPGSRQIVYSKHVGGHGGGIAFYTTDYGMMWGAFEQEQLDSCEEAAEREQDDAL